MNTDTSKTHKWNMADTMTAVRMAASVLLAVLTPKSLVFFAVYTLAGLTDVLDGWFARKTGVASSFGARFDSIADLLFYGIVLYRLVPILWHVLPLEIWYAVAGTLLVRMAAYGTAAIKYHRFAALHTWLNKLTGAAVFLLPYVLIFTTGVVYGWIVCALAFVASFEELMIHLCRQYYCAATKSFFQKKRNSADGEHGTAHGQTR